METYGIPEAAQMLSLPSSTVRTMIEEGALEARHIDGRWRVTRYAVERARVRLQPGPRPVGEVDLPVEDAAPAEIEARLTALERRLDRLEAGAEAEPPASMRPALAHLFRPES
jgi:excisionase family DNA binding protein